MCSSASSITAHGAESPSLPMTTERIEWLDIDRLAPSADQPRKRFDPESLEDLAASLEHAGMLQPIVVRPLPGSHPPRFEIVAGERRWRAAQRAGLRRVPVLIRHLDDSETALAALVENLQRENLTLLEEARAVRRLVETHGLTHEAVARRCGYRTRDRVTHLLRILRLPQDVLELLDRKALSFGHAKLLAGLDTVAERSRWAHETVRHGWSVETLARRLRGARARPKKSGEGSGKDPNVARLERNLSEHLGVPVALRMKDARKGELVLRFDSLDVLDGLLEKIGFRME